MGARVNVRFPKRTRLGAIFDVSRNPTRHDRRPGSFKVNRATGKWGDFATGDRGGDLVSLAAYLFKISQADAALRVAEMIGVEPYEQ